MVAQFPIVVEREDSGVSSAYVAGLPVYAQGATARQAEQALRRTLTVYLEAHPDATITNDAIACIETQWETDCSRAR